MVCKPNVENIVKSGTYLYDGSVVCDVCIVYSPVRFGTGDEQDAPDIEQDVEVDTYYVYFGSITQRGHYNAGGGCFATLAQAVDSVAKQPGVGETVQWANS